MPTMKSFKMSNLNTDAEGSPPPPPAPADPSVEAANAAVAAAAAAAAAAAGVDGGQYNDMYPTYNTYLMTRYSDQRYHTPSYTTTPSYSSHISAHTSTGDSGYYRYPDYSRYPYSGGNPSGPTSPRWRRRSYDPEYLTTSRQSRNTGSAGSTGSGTGNNRPLSDLAASLVNSPAGSAVSNATAAASGSTSGSSASSVLMRSRSRSRVPSEYDPNAYLRYVSPSTSGYSTGSSTQRPMSGYIYGHSYIPTTSSLHNMPDQPPSVTQPRFAGSTSGSVGGPTSVASSSVSPNAAANSMQPQPPPNYNAMDREVSARIRRYQADPSS